MRDRSVVATLMLTIAIVVMSSFVADANDEPFLQPEGLAEGWYARIDTSMGRIIARLLPEQAPQSVAHFAAMAEGRLEWFDPITGEINKSPYYDGIKIHKALAGKRFEAGDPRGTGLTPAEMYVPPEEVQGPINFNRPGRLGMTADSGRFSAVQFFATMSAQPWLSGRYPCFGEVVRGRTVIENISQVKTYPNDRPIDAPVIELIRIFSAGNPDPLPEPERYWPQQRKLEQANDPAK